MEGRKVAVWADCPVVSDHVPTLHAKPSGDYTAHAVLVHRALCFVPVTAFLRSSQDLEDFKSQTAPVLL